MRSPSPNSIITQNSFDNENIVPINLEQIFNNAVETRRTTETSIFGANAEKERAEEEKFNLYAKHWAVEEKYEQEIKDIINKLEDLMEQQMEICNTIMKSMSEYKRKLR